MTPFKKMTLALLAATVAGTAVTASVAVSAREGSQWGESSNFGWHKRGGKRGGQLFDRFDANEDDSISQEEVDAQSASLFAEADADNNGIVTLDEFKVQFLAKSDQMRIKAFQRIDRDGDGSVSQEDFNKLSDRIFSRMDRDDDGVIEPKMRGERGKRKAEAGQDGSEGKKQRRAEKDRGERGGKHHGRRGRGPMKMLFTTFDQNADGKVTREEFEAVRADLFASADTNGSGSFDLDGFSNIWATLNEDRVVRMFQSLDTDGDLGVTAEEQQTKTANLVSRMDRNNDGVITKADLKRGKWKWGRHGKGHDRGEGNDN